MKSPIQQVMFEGFRGKGGKVELQRKTWSLESKKQDGSSCGSETEMKGGERNKVCCHELEVEKIPLVSGVTQL